jgi:Delta3,5-Delta2,4-dienoyl-CoA isomerase
MTTNLIDGLSVRPHPFLNEYQSLNVLVWNGDSNGEGPSGRDPKVAENRDSVDDTVVVIVALNRPLKHNAIHSAMWREIGHVFSQIGRIGDDCRAVLLVGNGPSFCAGIDVTDNSFATPKSQPSDDDRKDDDVARRGIAWRMKLQHMQACFTALETCPVPIVAALHGVCFGAGIDLACCADIRLGADNTIFSVKEVALGLAADVGTLQRFPKQVGNDSLARELCLTGRTFAVTEALSLGWISRSYPLPRLVPAALQLCREMSQHSPLAVQGTKAALVYARDHSVADSLEQVAWYNALALQGPDITRAWSVSKTKRRPHFARIPPYAKL